MTDSSGTNVQDIYYYPYGGIKTNTGSDIAKHKFTGQEWDAETGLYYYGARYYDPKLARFISADTIVPYLYFPQSLNRYSYVLNNPLKYVDPTGHIFGIDDLLIAAAAGALFGGAVAAVTGGDTDDILRGAITGAITGVAFWGAGEIIGAMNAAAGAEISSITQAGIHAGAGALSGGINSAITGSDMGLGMLTGGISGGIANYAGGFLPKEFGYQLAGRTVIGGVTGGIASEMYGGSFGRGFRYGAATAGAGFLFNDWWHDKFMPWARRVFKGSQIGTGYGIRPKYKVGLLKIEAGYDEITGKRLGLEGIEKFSAKSLVASFEGGPVKVGGQRINGVSNFDASASWKNISINQALTVEVGGTYPLLFPYAVNFELHIHFNEILK